MGSGDAIPAPPKRIGRDANSHDRSDPTTPRIPSHARLMRGVVDSARARPTGDSAVRRIQFTLQAEKHCRKMREADRGSPSETRRSSAKARGFPTCSSAQSWHLAVPPTGLPRTARQADPDTRGISVKNAGGRSNPAAGTRTEHFPRFSCDTSLAASFSSWGRRSCRTSRGPTKYPSSRYHCDLAG